MVLNRKLFFLKKVFRYIFLYGLGRTVFKVAGRSNIRLPLVLIRFKNPDVALIGCGQFGFSTIGYFISQKFGRRFLWCFDSDQEASRRFQSVYNVSNAGASVEQLLFDPGVKTVYIATNHCSHSDYAIASLEAGKDVYVEKPIAVTHKQLSRLCYAVERHGRKVFAGYNRPFSGAIRFLNSRLDYNEEDGISLNCFVSGHKIDSDHWYRSPEEGTRICGNAGHWLDLFVHMLGWRQQPNVFHIHLLSADPKEPDDNFSLSISTDQGDIFSLMLSARSEPFEGINETINFQQGNVICKIDDFRKMRLWKEDELVKKTFWPKDVGHKLAILQPFQTPVTRDWDEVVRSTLLMLHVTDMVRNGVTESTFSMAAEMSQLKEVVQAA